MAQPAPVNCIMKALLIFAGALIGVFALGLALILLFHPPITATVLGHRYILGDFGTHHSLSANEIAQLNGYIRRGVIARPDEVFTALISFYDKLIVLLVTLLGVMGVFTYFSVRTVSRRDAESFSAEAARAAVKAYLESQEFAARIDGQIEPNMEKLRQGMEDLGVQQEQLEELMERAESFVSERDHSEDLDRDLKIEGESGGGTTGG